MERRHLPFVVRDLEASIPAGLPIELGGRRFESGRIAIALDEEAPAEASAGTLDYDHERAEVCFRVRADFPDAPQALRLAGEAVPSVRGVIISRGAILPDHSFAMSGTFRLGASPLPGAEALEARVLPGT
jgi:hypothetical protein